MEIWRKARRADRCARVWRNIGCWSVRTVLIAVLLAAAAASAFAADGERWVFVGATSEPTYKQDGVYEATFSVRKQLAGPALPRRARVLISGQIPQDLEDKQWFVVARRGETGELAAGQEWRILEKGRLCLWPDDISELSLQQHFAKAEAGEGGRRCIKV